MSEPKQVTVVRTIGWPEAFLKIASAIGWLLVLIIVLCFYNYKDMVKTWRQEVHPVKCEPVATKVVEEK
jgi:hypothetical protein